MNCLDLIKEKLQKFPGRTFTIMINNNILDYSTDPSKSRIVKAKFRKDKYHSGLTVGYFQKIGMDMKLRNLDEVIDRIDTELLETKIGSIDLGAYIKDKTKVEIKIDSDFNIIEFTTPAYKIAKQVSVQNKGAMTGGAIGGIDIDVYTMTQLYNWFTKYSIEAYHNVVKFILLRKLKEAQDMKLYFLLNAYVPVMIYGDASSFLFNPFTGLPLYRQEFEKSRMYLLSRQTVKNYFGLTVSFLTAKEICQGFSLNKFVKFNYEFFIEILGGWFCDEMPTTNKEFYILQYANEDFPKVLTVDEFNDSDWAKGNYRKITTLTYACMLYSRALEVPDRQIQDFCELMGKRSLINA